MATTFVEKVFEVCKKTHFFRIRIIQIAAELHK